MRGRLRCHLGRYEVRTHIGAFATESCPSGSGLRTRGAVIERARPLTTALLVLARTKASRIVRVRSADKEGTIVVRQGRVLAVTAPCAYFGELISGGIPAHIAPRRGETIGEALVREGKLAPLAIDPVLRRQMQRRLAVMLAWRGVSLDQLPLESDTPAVVVEGACPRDLLLAALRELTAHTPIEEIERELHKTSWVLSMAGEDLVTKAALHPDEEAAVTRLRRPASFLDLREAARGSERALRLVWALVRIEAVAVPLARGANMALLLSKTRAARAHTGMVDLRGQKPNEARASVRRLASRLHPDRLGPHAPEGIVAASNRVMGELNLVVDALRRRGA